MQNSKILLYSFIHSLGVVIYTSGVVWLMTHGEQIFGSTQNNFLAPLAILLLFVLSATITGSLVLLKPIYLYLSNAKKEAVQLFLGTIAWLAIFMSIIFGILLVV